MIYDAVLAHRVELCEVFSEPLQYGGELRNNPHIGPLKERLEEIVDIMIDEDIDVLETIELSIQEERSKWSGLLRDYMIRYQNQLNDYTIKIVIDCLHEYAGMIDDNEIVPYP